MGARARSPGAAGRVRRVASRRGATGVGAGTEGDALASPGGPGDRAGGVGRGATRTTARLPAPLPPLEEVSPAGLLRGGRRASERRFAGGSLWWPRSLQRPGEAEEAADCRLRTPARASLGPLGVRVDACHPSLSSRAKGTRNSCSRESRCAVAESAPVRVAPWGERQDPHSSGRGGPSWGSSVIPNYLHLQRCNDLGSSSPLC